MEAYNRFYKVVFEWERKIARLIGHDVFVEKLKITFMTVVVYLWISIAYVSEIYTVLCYSSVEKIYGVVFSLITFQVGNEYFSQSINFQILIQFNEFIS